MRRGGRPPEGLDKESKRLKEIVADRALDIDMLKELLDLSLLDSVPEAQVRIDDWREEYNTYRPHQSLGYLTPVEFTRR